MRKKAQFSVELFIVLSFFVLVLLWFNNYYSHVRSQDLLFLQQRNLLEQVSVLQGEAFVSNQTLRFAVPCLASEGKTTPYWVYGGSLDSQGVLLEGSNETTLYAVVFSSNQSLASSFPVNASPNPLAFECIGDNAGEIVFSKSLVVPPGGGAATAGVLMRKG